MFGHFVGSSAYRSPGCEKVSVNLVSNEHVDLPFHNDREVGVLEKVFAPDAERMLEEFRTELNSATFAARRLQLTRSQPVGKTKSGGDGMHGLTRGALTLFGVAVAGFLIWFGASALPGEGDATVGEFWWAAGLIAAAGLTMALSQLLGGWTKWGWPRISGNVLLLGFLPALIAGGWVVAAGEPGDHWLGSHVRSWSDDIGLESLVGDLMKAWPALAFGVGLAFGLTFDTTGPGTESVRWRWRRTVGAAAEQPEPEARDGEPDDRRVDPRRRDAAH